MLQMAGTAPVRTGTTLYLCGVRVLTLYLCASIRRFVHFLSFITGYIQWSQYVDVQ